MRNKFQICLQNLRNRVFLGFFFCDKVCWSAVKRGENYLVCSTFAARLQQKYLKKWTLFSRKTGKCPFSMQILLQPFVHLLFC